MLGRGGNVDYYILLSIILEDILDYDFIVIDSHHNFAAYFSSWQDCLDYLENFFVKKYVVCCEEKTLYVVVDYVIEVKE